jgi:MFS transporter, CP family, cyanate transporter
VPRPSRQAALLPLVFGVGFQLRSVILSLPPVLPALRGELHLSFAAVGALTALPLLCMSVAAVPGALLVHRAGARVVIGVGVLTLGAAGVLRVAPPQPVTLFAFTTLMTLGVAVAQPAMTAYIRVHFHGFLQRAAGVYTTSLTVGSLAAASLGVPLLALAGWRWSLVIWSLPALLLAALWLLRAPTSGAEHGGEPATIASILRSRAAWYAAAIFGIQSLAFYTVVAWLPFRLQGASPAYLSLVLLAMTSAGLPTGLVLTALRWRWASSRLLYAGAGVLIAATDVCFLVGFTPLAWLCAFLLNVGVTMAFAGSNALPTLLGGDARRVAGYAALVLTAGYLIAMAGPAVSGLLVDRTHDLNTPFWLVMGAALALVPLGLTLPAPPGDQ